MKTGHRTGTVASERPVHGVSAEGALDRTTNGMPTPRLLDYKSASVYVSLSCWSLRELVLNGETPHGLNKRKDMT